MSNKDVLMFNTPAEENNCHYSPRAVIFLLFASVSYLGVLSFLNARGLRASNALIGASELMIYLACIWVYIRRIPLSITVIPVFISAWLVFAWMIRGEIDAKGIRDLIIPILFLSLGKYVADIKFADRALKIILSIVIAIGLFEVFFTDTYAQLFNTFMFYVNTGVSSASDAMFKGQMLALNGYRPEGGRTFLPWILGSHRASSLLMEPVSLGNYAVLMLAWGLSKEQFEFKSAHFFLWGAALLIILTDSRFALMMAAPILLMRFLPAQILDRSAILIPFFIFIFVLLIALIVPSDGDNILGRITKSGDALLNFDLDQIFGLYSPLPNYGDMGYAYVLSRFGLPACIALISLLFLLPTEDLRAKRFRVYLVFYASMILTISGTSFFALKTAGLLWFMMGILSAQKPEPHLTEAPLASVDDPFIKKLLARKRQENA